MCLDSIYGLWKALNETSGSLISRMKFDEKGNNRFSLKIDNEFFDLFIEDCKQVVNSFKGKIENFFQDSSRKVFASTEFGLEVSKEEVINALNRLNNIGEFNLSYGVIKISLKKNFLDIEIQETQSNNKN